MANVDRKLHDADSATDREPELPKRGLKGASGGVYLGPTRPTSGDSNTSHATGPAAGGVEDSTGYRKRDKYEDNGAGAAFAANTRPTGRTAYTAPGVQGGSVPGDPAGSVDNRAVEQLRALGADGRGTSYQPGTADPVGTGVTAGLKKSPRQTGTPIIPRPAIGASDGPAAGTVAVIPGDDLFTIDLHADDITGGANGLAGCVVDVFTRGTDTDEIGEYVGTADFDSATAGGGLTGLASATTYHVEVRFKDAAGNVGPVQMGTLLTT
jgi:hypothetical protein